VMICFYMVGGIVALVLNAAWIPAAL